MFNTNNIPSMVTINIPPMVRSYYSRAPSLHAIKNAKIGFINEAKIQRMDSSMKENRV
jgi:hypothetical protein